MDIRHRSSEGSKEADIFVSEASDSSGKETWYLPCVRTVAVCSGDAADVPLTRITTGSDLLPGAFSSDASTIFCSRISGSEFESLGGAIGFDQRVMRGDGRLSFRPAGGPWPQTCLKTTAEFKTSPKRQERCLKIEETGNVQIIDSPPHPAPREEQRSIAGYEIGILPLPSPTWTTCSPTAMEPLKRMETLHTAQWREMVERNTTKGDVSMTVAVHLLSYLRVR